MENRKWKREDSGQKMNSCFCRNSPFYFLFSVFYFLSNIFLLTLSILIAMPAISHSDQKIKNPNVSGQFYDSSPTRLSAVIDKFFFEADVTPYDRHIDVVISPHAGYIYSAGVAAYGFKAASRNKYKTIIILAPSHFHGFSGISVGLYDGFKTPLGVAQVDLAFARKLESSSEKIYFEPKAFEREHSLEVQLPFIQKTFSDFKIVPVVFGQIDAGILKNFAQSLVSLIKERTDVLIVASTDMSHFHDDEFARNMDRHTIEAIKNFDIDGLVQGVSAGTMELCGSMPVIASMIYAKLRGSQNVDVLKYANSGDVSGDKSQVVGYMSAVILGQTPFDISPHKRCLSQTLTKKQKKRLLNIARMTIEEHVKTGKKLEFKETDPRLKETEGAFVTIHKKGQLRGCIGNIIGRGPLYQTIRNMAISASSQDTRFSPVTVDELKDIDIEISVLTIPRVTKNIDEIKMGVHGVIVSKGIFNQGVFLPQVATDTGWSKEQFLSVLCAQKAHLPPDAWKDPETKIEIFEAIVFGEK